MRAVDSALLDNTRVLEFGLSYLPRPCYLNATSIPLLLFPRYYALLYSTAAALYTQIQGYSDTPIQNTFVRPPSTLIHIMTAVSTTHRGLRVYRLFLAFLGLAILGLNIAHIVYLEKGYSSMTPEQRAEAEIESSFREDYPKLLLPDLGLNLMFLILVVGRPRLSNQKLHSVCRIMFSLAIAFGLVYLPARLVNSLAQMTKRSQALYESMGGTEYPFTFENRYFCSTSIKRYGDADRSQCITIVSRDMMSFIAAFLVVIELVIAGVVGEIGTR